MAINIRGATQSSQKLVSNTQLLQLLYMEETCLHLRYGCFKFNINTSFRIKHGQGFNSSHLLLLLERIKTYFLETCHEVRRDSHTEWLLPLSPRSSLQLLTLKRFWYKFEILGQTKFAITTVYTHGDKINYQ